MMGPVRKPETSLYTRKHLSLVISLDQMIPGLTAVLPPPAATAAFLSAGNVGPPKKGPVPGGYRA